MILTSPPTPPLFSWPWPQFSWMYWVHCEALPQDLLHAQKDMLV